MNKILFLIFLISLYFFVGKSAEQFFCKDDGFFPDPYECAKFYRCYSGQKFEFTCSPGTIFNPQHNGCDWPHSVPECQLLRPESNSGHSEVREQQQYGSDSNSWKQSQGVENYNPYGQTFSEQNRQKPGQKHISQHNNTNIKKQQKNDNDDERDKSYDNIDGKSNRRNIQYRPHRRYIGTTTSTTKLDYDYDENVFDQNSYEDLTKQYITKKPEDIRYGERQQHLTTESYRIPPAITRTRSRTSSTAATTNTYSEHDYQFLDLFSNGEEKLPSFLEDKDYLTFEDWIKFSEFETTTADNLHNNYRNKSITQINKKYGQYTTTTLRPKTSTNKRQRKQFTTTNSNPFAEWSQENDENNKKSYEYNKNVDHNFKNDPLKIPDLMAYLSCNETSQGCDKCQEFDWIKYNGLTIQLLPYRSYKFMRTYAVKQCFKSCVDTKQCIAFAYSVSTGMCHIYDTINIGSIESNSDWVLVVENPRSGVLREEWVYTKNGKITGQELTKLTTDNYISCLKQCTKLSDKCRAVSFDLSNLQCQLFDENEAYSIKSLKVNSVTLQHMSIFNENNNKWRFTDNGEKTLNISEAFLSIYIRETEECFHECLENTDSKCWFVVIENTDDYYKACHIFGYQSSPKWIQRNQINNENYILNVPINHTDIEQYSGYSYVGNPVEVKQDMTPEECKHYAEEKCDYCRKFTSIIETKECALFSDSAMLSPALDQPNQNEISGLISIPNNWEYLAYKRIPWIMFTSNNHVYNPFELKGEINGHKCLKFCVEQKLCLVTAIVYDITDNTMFCYFFNEQHIENSNITEYENAELFIKIHNTNDIPIVTKRSSQQLACSDGKALEDAIANMDAFDDDIDVISKQIPVEKHPHKNDDKPLSPHGYDFFGGPHDEEYDHEISVNQKYQSSVRHSRDVTEHQIHFETLEPQNNYNNAKDFVRLVQSHTNNDELLKNIRTIAKELKKVVKRKSFIPKTSDFQLNKLSAKNCDRNDFTRDDDNDCDVENNKNDLICLDVPYIIYSESQAMSSCNGKAIDSYCDVICKTGYQPNKSKVKCESKSKSGDAIWETKHVKCLPKDSDCEQVDHNKVIRIKVNSDYPKQRLHYILRYDIHKKLPSYVAYFHTRDNNAKQVNSSAINRNLLNKHPCKLLNNHQISPEKYNLSDYIIKPLLANNAFLYSKDADLVSSYSVTNAPQDPFTSGGPWSTLENRTLEILKTRPGIVITGVCPNPIISDPLDIHTKKLNGDNDNKKNEMEIPECFWKIVCVPLDNEVTAASFYAENSHPLSQLEKQSRVEQLRQYRGQEFVARLLGSQMFKNIWKDTYDSYKDINPNMKLFIMKCSSARTINSLEAIKFWDRVIKDDKFGAKWPSNFAYGLEITDNNNDNVSSQYNGEQTESNTRVNMRSVSGSDHTKQNEDKFANISKIRFCDNENNDRKVIGYITSGSNKSFTINSGTLLTDVVFAHIHIDSEGNIAPYDADHTGINAIVYNKLYEMLAIKTKLIGKNKRLNTLVSIGGWNNSNHFSSVAASPQYRNNLITDIIQLIDYWNLDGIEIDWKYPVIGGKNSASVDDKTNFVILLAQLRKAFKVFENARRRSEPLLLSITGASAHGIVDKAYDLEKLVLIVDWINVMTFDYFGPWKSKWGTKTGPNAPLYNSAPITQLSRMNIHSTLKHYFCSLNNSKKLVMSIPFYGHYWNNVGEPIDSNDDHYRQAESSGGFVRYSDIKSNWISNQQFNQYQHEKSYTPWLWNEIKRILLSYENEVSIEQKVRYAIEHELGGVALWSIDFDTDHNELLGAVSQSYSKNFCDKHNEKSENGYKCNPLKNEKRWWTDKEGSKSGMCGRSAPLINGYYPACDPDNPSLSCCSSWGRCGSGPQFCDCERCVDYGRNPELLREEPQKPKDQIVRWFTKVDSVTDDNDNNQPICGYKAPLLNNSYPICNPDDDYRYCCSGDGFCGIGYSFCNCKDCVNFRANPKFSYLKKLWWDKSDGANKSGRCGKKAPKINSTFPICNPYSEDAYCCGKYGHCGSGPNSCECIGCVNFKKNPYFRWK